MRRAAFADLVGVSKQMISKYAAAGLVVEVDGEVDAAATLAALEGRLDETKRLQALQALGGLKPARTAFVAAPAPVKSAKAEKDQVELQLKRLQYGREVGELVSAEAVDAAARAAVATMREAFGNHRRESAERICLEFGLPPEKATPMARRLSAEFEETLGVFAREMATLAAHDAKPAHAQDQIPSATPALETA